VRRRLRYQRGVAKGLVHDAADAFRTDRDFEDAELVQKVRSEAVGPWKQRTGHSGDVEVAVESGEVTLDGSIDDPDERRMLLRLVESVEGVRSITDRLVSIDSP
jgi:osmotically-inducible protein OsmY